MIKIKVYLINFGADGYPFKGEAGRWKKCWKFWKIIRKKQNYCSNENPDNIQTIIKFVKKSNLWLKITKYIC